MPQLRKILFNNFMGIFFNETRQEKAGGPPYSIQQLCFMDII